MSKPPSEITYDQAAELFGVSPRQTRTILRKYEQLCRPIVRGYRSILFPRRGILRVQRQRQRDMIAAFAAKRKARK